MSVPRTVLLLLAVLATKLTHGAVWPDATWPTSTPAAQSMDAADLTQARNFALRGGGSGMIIRHGFLVYSWGSLTTRYDIKSSTKSFGATALGVALVDGRVSLSGHAQSYLSTLGVPPTSNRSTGWLDDITVLQLATHTAGFDKTGAESALIFRPGTKWGYSDGGPNWLADVLTTRYNRDLLTVMTGRVFTPLRISSSDLVWRSNAYRSDTLNGIKRREFGSGISCNVNAMARLGLLHLRGGVWRSTRVISSTYVSQVRTAAPSIKGLPITNPTQYPGATSHYGILWWDNADGRMSGVPRDAYWAWGLGDSLIVVIPSLDIVVARAGATMRTIVATDPKGLEPFIRPIVTSTQSSATSTTPASSSLVNEQLSAPLTVEAEVDASVSQAAVPIPTPGNRRPDVHAGADLALILPQDTATLGGSVSDDGLPGGALTTEWRELNGSDAVFSAPNDPHSAVTFGSPGTYVLELTVTDGELPAKDELIVTVMDPAAPAATLPAVAIEETRSPRTMWLAFDMSGSAAGTLATLSIPIAAVQMPGSLEVHRVLDAWDTGTLRKRHMPALDPVSIAIYSVQREDAGLEIELDVTDAVSNWSSADAARGLAVVEVSGQVVIGNTNGSGRPEIRLSR